MSATLDQSVGEHARREADEAHARWAKTRQSWRPTAVMIENATLFAVATTAYAALGIWVVLQKHVLVFDGLSRLSHAYFVWWNAPPKLTAIGFVWPPIATLIFLPFAAIKPLATSLVALPLTSAVAGGLLLVVLNRVLTLVGMLPWQRYCLLAAFGANPMIAFYAANGMAEALYLLFLLGAVYGFMRWYLTRAPGALITIALFFSLGILTRYEVFGWAVVLTASIAFVGIRQRVTRAELEGTLLTYLAPIAYGVGLWLFFNWLILGTPIFFLRQQTPGAPLSPGAVAPPAATDAPVHALDVAQRLVALNWNLFPLTLLVVAALLVTAYRRRDLMTWSLIGIIVLNAAFTWLIVMESGALSYLQLRYNMRAMPVAVTGVAWLYLIARGRRRTWIWATAFAALVLSIPLTGRTMEHFTYQFREADFIRAVTGRGGIPDQLAAERPLARYIDAHVHRRDAILTDDSQAFAAMLIDGRPELFADRIDHGDAKWLELLAFPWGRVQYLLVIPGGPDLALQRYPRAASGDEPGLEPVFRSGKYVLLRVAATRPTRNRNTLASMRR